RAHVDLNTAVGIAFYLFLEFHGCFRVRRAFHQDVGECEVEISSVCGAAEHHGHDGRHGDFLPVFAGHVYSFINDGYWCRLKRPAPVLRPKDPGLYPDSARMPAPWQAAGILPMAGPSAAGLRAGRAYPARWVV